MIYPVRHFGLMQGWAVRPTFIWGPDGTIMKWLQTEQHREKHSVVRKLLNIYQLFAVTDHTFYRYRSTKL